MRLPLLDLQLGLLLYYLEKNQTIPVYKILVTSSLRLQEWPAGALSQARDTAQFPLS